MFSRQASFMPTNPASASFLFLSRIPLPSFPNATVGEPFLPIQPTLQGDKKMKKFGFLMAVVFAICFWAFVNAHATIDSTKALHEYISQGRHADYLVNDVLNHNGPATTRIQTTTYTFPLDITEASGATNDSDYTALWTCPPGVTFTVDSVFVWALTEGDVDGDSPGGFRINVRKYDLSATAYDTLVTDVIDAESLAYNLQNSFLSWGAGIADTTKVFETGDGLIVMVAQDSAFVTSASCTGLLLTVKGRLIR